MMLIGNEDGTLVAYKLSDGSQQWSQKFKGMIRSIGRLMTSCIQVRWMAQSMHTGPTSPQMIEVVGPRGRDILLLACSPRTNSEFSGGVKWLSS